MIPGEMRFDPTSNPPQFSDGQGDPITKDTVLRLKLVGIRTDIGQIHAIGSIKDVGISRSSYLQLLISSRTTLGTLTLPPARFGVY